MLWNGKIMFHFYRNDCFISSYSHEISKIYHRIVDKFSRNKENNDKKRLNNKINQMTNKESHCSTKTSVVFSFLCLFKWKNVNFPMKNFSLTRCQEKTKKRMKYDEIFRWIRQQLGNNTTEKKNQKHLWDDAFQMEIATRRNISVRWLWMKKNRTKLPIKLKRISVSI